LAESDPFGFQRGGAALVRKKLGEKTKKKKKMGNGVGVQSNMVSTGAWYE